MATKKGIIITATILGVITAASFMIWQIPNNPQMSIVVSDFRTHINGIDERYRIISSAVDESFEQMLNDEISSDEYISIAEISSSQINSQIIELVESEATDEWIDSYLNNLESLRVFANLLNQDSTESEKNDLIAKIEQLKQESKDFAELSLSSRP